MAASLHDRLKEMIAEGGLGVPADLADPFAALASGPPAQPRPRDGREMAQRDLDRRAAERQAAEDAAALEAAKQAARDAKAEAVEPVPEFDWDAHIADADLSYDELLEQIRAEDEAA